jgi:hypothetical protein
MSRPMFVVLRSIGMFIVDLFKSRRRLEAHLRQVLIKFAIYYNECRIHRSLNKDAPFHRAIERLGAITSQPVLGGLHHQYCRA